MNRKQWLLTVSALLIMTAGAGALWQLKAHQRLGKPGVLTRALPDSRNEEVVLPERVLDYTSRNVPTEKLVLDALPADTCFGTRHYRATDDFEILGSVVLMGSDRTSLHKPEYCLRGAGWQIVSAERITIPITHPFKYELPASKLIVTRQQPAANGQVTTLNGVYIYWYVTDGAISGDPTGAERMWAMARKLLQTGELQRWAYVTFLAPCAPGQEAATEERMRQFIAAAVPDFQTTRPEKEIADGRKE